MSGYTMRLLKCPACGGPTDPTTAKNNILKCPYCGNSMEVPESLRKPEPSQVTTSSSPYDFLAGANLQALNGYGQRWGEVVQLATAGKRDEAIEKYKAYTGASDSDAKRMVDTLAGAQVYDYTGTAYPASYVAPIIAAHTETAKSMTRFSMWLSCGITAFVFFIVLLILIPTLLGVFGSLFAVFGN